MAPTPERAEVKVGRFDPARVFPPGDKLTVPLFRLMMATGDARCASLLFVMVYREVRDTAGAESALHAGRMWYPFRPLCSHLSEAGYALDTLLSSVPRQRLRKLLRGRPVAPEELERLREALGDGTYVRKVRHSDRFALQPRRHQARVRGRLNGRARRQLADRVRRRRALAVHDHRRPRS